MSKQRLTVRFVNRFYWPDTSATSQILTGLTEALETAEYDIEVVTSRLNYADAQVAYASHEQHGSVKVRRLWSTRFGRAGTLGRLSDYLTIYAAFFFYLLFKSRAGDIIVLKTDPPMLSVPGAIVGMLKRVRLVAWCQDVFPEVAMAEMKLPAPVRLLMRLLQKLRDWSLRRCDRVVVLGADMEDYLLQRGIHAEAMVRIANWAVVEEIADEAEIKDLRARWDIAATDFVIGYSGNLGRAHDWETFYQASQLLADLPHLVFLVCGGGYGYDQLQAAVEAGGASARFRFLSYQPKAQLAASLGVPDLHWFTLKARLTPFIFPSKFYGILQAGRPAVFIGKPDSEIGHILQQEKIGGVVAEGDAVGLAALFRRMVTNQQLVQTAGEGARMVWQQRFRKSGETARWQSMISQLVVQNLTIQ